MFCESKNVCTDSGINHFKIRRNFTFGLPFAGSSVNMNFVKLVVFYGVISYVSAVEPFSAFGAIGAVVAGIYTVFTPIKCQFNECCTSKWINLNTTGKVIN